MKLPVSVDDRDTRLPPIAIDRVPPSASASTSAAEAAVGSMPSASSTLTESVGYTRPIPAPPTVQATITSMTS